MLSYPRFFYSCEFYTGLWEQRSNHFIILGRSVCVDCSNQCNSSSTNIWRTRFEGRLLSGEVAIPENYLTFQMKLAELCALDLQSCKTTAGDWIWKSNSCRQCMNVRQIFTLANLHMWKNDEKNENLQTIPKTCHGPANDCMSMISCRRRSLSANLQLFKCAQKTVHWFADSCTSEEPE